MRAVGRLHRLPTGNTCFIPKGVSRFKTHEEANRHQLDFLVEGLVQVFPERSGCAADACVGYLPAAISNKITTSAGPIGNSVASQRI